MSNKEPGQTVTPEQLSISFREMVEFIDATKQLIELSRKHERSLYGNGQRGLLRDMDDVKRTIRTVAVVFALFAVPFAAVIVSFIAGVLINRIEIIIH